MDMLRNRHSLQIQAVSWGEKTVPFFIVAIHFSPSVTLVLSIIIALLWLASGHIRHTVMIGKQTPAAFYALLLLALLAISVSYSAAPFPQAFATLSKYRELLLLLILVPFLNSEAQRTRCENFLLAALIASLLISFSGYLNLLPPGLAKYMLKNRITHSLFMAFLGFYCMHRLYAKDQRPLIWLTLLSLVVINLFVVSDGRTGQLGFLLLCALFFLQIFSFRTALLLTLVGLGAFALFLLFFPNRFMEGIHESIAFYNHPSEVESTSMGDRLRFWSNALSIIGQAPWLGEGVGGFPYKFHQLFPDYPILTNPHNEYLLIASQLGLPGLLVLLALLASILRQTLKLPAQQRRLSQGLWLMLCASCLFNSSIFDHTEGHWFMALLALYSAPLITLPICSASSSSQETNPNTSHAA